MSRKANPIPGLVYSTEYGKMCPACSKPLAKCACGQKPTALKGEGWVRVALETKGRQGKGVTLITGVAVSPVELGVLARALKQRCGSGGTVKNGIIEIQGDHRDILIEELTKQGYKVKRSGG